MSSEPNPRFSQYTEIIKNNEIVGFKLDGNDFQFLFDKQGGWYDQQGKYYNANAIQSQQPENQSDQDSQPQEINQNQKSQHFLQQQMLTHKNNNQKNNRIQIMRNFQEILETYPDNQQIGINFSLQPTVENESQIVEDFINSKINEKITVQNGSINGIFGQQLAAQVIELQGCTIQKQGRLMTLYIYVDLFESIDISVKMQRSELQFKLNELCYEKNSDYANIVEQKEGSEVTCYFQIRKDIASELKQDLNYQVQQK